MTSLDSLSDFPCEGRPTLAEQVALTDFSNDLTGSLVGLEALCRTANQRLETLQATIGYLSAASDSPSQSPQMVDAMSEVRTIAAKVYAIETQISRMNDAPGPLGAGAVVFHSTLPAREEYVIPETVKVRVSSKHGRQRLADAQRTVNQMWEDLEEVRAAFRPLKAVALNHPKAVMAAVALPVIGLAFLAVLSISGYIGGASSSAPNPSVAASQPSGPATVPVELPATAVGLVDNDLPTADAPVPPQSEPTQPARPEPRVPVARVAVDRAPASTPASKPAPAKAAQANPPMARPAIAQGARFAGTLLVDSQPSGAVVRVNQQQVGTTPLRLNQKAGTHTVWVERDGYQRWTGAVLIPADKQTHLNVRLDLVKRQD